MAYRYDVYGVGHAIVDTEAQVEDLLLTNHGVDKGIMTLVSTDTQARLLDGLNGRQLLNAAGGSAANTMVGVAQLGGRAFFVGKIGADMQGAFYRESMAEAGVDFEVDPVEGEATGSCLILVTPDGERSMQTSLGASSRMASADIDTERLAASRIAYVEGYLYGSPTGAEAAELTMRTAAAAGIKVSLSLSDPGMAAHFLDPFRQAAKRYVDILFCNEHEAEIYAGGGSRQERLRAAGEDVPLVFMTCGGDGSMVYDSGTITEVKGHAVPVVDTTGAGDAFAAGTLFGLTQGMGPVDAARLGSFTSARIVTQLGPRLTEPLRHTIDSILEGAHPLG